MLWALLIVIVLAVISFKLVVGVIGLILRLILLVLAIGLFFSWYNDKPEATVTAQPVPATVSHPYEPAPASSAAPAAQGEAVEETGAAE